MATDKSKQPDNGEVISRIAYLTTYAESIKTASDAVTAAEDRDTIEVAKTIFWLHESGVWIKSTEPKKATDSKGGRPADPKSVAAFCRYISDEAKLSPTYTKGLLAAGRWLDSFGHLVPETATLSGERALRPLIELDRKADLREDEMERAVKEAVTEADGAPITAAHTKVIAANMYKDADVKERAERKAEQRDCDADAEKLEQQIYALLAKLAKVEGGAEARKRIKAALSTRTVRVRVEKPAA